ncbi:MAG: HAD-IIA family hydrolase [bacterium]|nr:HAD-IIA family hydrolase [bacterium]
MENTTRFLSWFQENHQHFAGILFDVDGTILRKRIPIKGARETLELVEHLQLPYIFLTNDACHSRQEKSEVLQSAGLPVTPEHIVSSGDALKLFVRQRQLQGECFFIMGKLGEPNYAEPAGLKITRQLSELKSCRGVIIGEGYYDWESTFNAVLNYFRKQPEGLLIVPNTDDYFVDRHKDIHIAPGGKAAFLCGILEKCGICIEPIFLGKPHAPIFNYAIDMMVQRYNVAAELDPRQILMVGDSLSSDILGANMAGLSSCLLFTGVTSPAMLQQARQNPQKLPNYQFESL